MPLRTSTSFARAPASRVTAHTASQLRTFLLVCLLRKRERVCVCVCWEIREFWRYKMTCLESSMKKDPLTNCIVTYQALILHKNPDLRQSLSAEGLEADERKRCDPRC